MSKLKLLYVKYIAIKHNIHLPWVNSDVSDSEYPEGGRYIYDFNDLEFIAWLSYNCYIIKENFNMWHFTLYFITQFD